MLYLRALEHIPKAGVRAGNLIGVDTRTGDIIVQHTPPNAALTAILDAYDGGRAELIRSPYPHPRMARQVLEGLCSYVAGVQSRGHRLLRRLK